MTIIKPTGVTYRSTIKLPLHLRTAVWVLITRILLEYYYCNTTVILLMLLIYFPPLSYGHSTRNLLSDLELPGARGVISKAFVGFALAVAVNIDHG